MKLTNDAVRDIRAELIKSCDEPPTPEKCGALYAYAAILLFEVERSRGMESRPLRREEPTT